jgi:hypothetical protein
MGGLDIVQQVVTFLLGTTIGFFLRGVTDKLLDRMRGKGEVSNFEILSPFVAILVTIVWVMAVYTSMINPLFNVDLELHAIMGLVVGFLFNKNPFKSDKK